MPLLVLRLCLGLAGLCSTQLPLWRFLDRSLRLADGAGASDGISAQVSSVSSLSYGASNGLVGPGIVSMRASLDMNLGLWRDSLSGSLVSAEGGLV